MIFVQAWTVWVVVGCLVFCFTPSRMRDGTAAMLSALWPMTLVALAGLFVVEGARRLRRPKPRLPIAHLLTKEHRR